MRCLIEQVERQPAPGKGDGGFGLALFTVTPDERFQSARKFAAQALGLKESPLVKIRRVLQAEPGQEVILIERGGLGQQGYASSAVGGRAAGGHVRLELRHVQPDYSP